MVVLRLHLQFCEALSSLDKLIISLEIWLLRKYSTLCFTRWEIPRPVLGLQRKRWVQKGVELCAQVVSFLFCFPFGFLLEAPFGGNVYEWSMLKIMQHIAEDGKRNNNNWKKNTHDAMVENEPPSVTNTIVGGKCYYCYCGAPIPYRRTPLVPGGKVNRCPTMHACYSIYEVFASLTSTSLLTGTALSV